MEEDDEDSFFGGLDEEGGDLPYLLCLIKHPKGLYCEAAIVDRSENAIVFEVDEELVGKGYFKDKYLDTRDFELWGLSWYIVPHFTPTEH